MQIPRVAAAALLALAAGTLVGAAGGSAAAAAPVSASASPAAAQPGGTVTVSGRAAGCATQPFNWSQAYTIDNGGRRSAQGTGGVTDGQGRFSFSVTVPAGATRSDIFLPYAEGQWDSVTVNFPVCGAVGGVDINVLPLRRDMHISLSPASPRSGSTATVTATNCVGGPVPTFLYVIDGSGTFYPIEGSISGTTFHGTVDLSRGNKGDAAARGAARPSPAGVQDAVALVPCSQTEGPTEDAMLHSTGALDFSISPAPGQRRPSAPPTSSSLSGSESAAGYTSAAGSNGGAVEEAPPATAVSGEATFTG